MTWKFILTLHSTPIRPPFNTTSILSTHGRSPGKWQLNIAFTKCNTMQLGAHFAPPHLPTLHIADQPLARTTLLTDLGIKFDHNLKFNDHIQDITNRAYQRSNLIFRCFLSRDTNSLVRAYKTYVRPLLEYNSVVWSPSQICHINSIEAVQRAFTKRLHAIQNLPYSQRLSNLQLQTLKHRRLITDLSTCFIIIYGHSALQFDEFFTASHCPSLRGHSKKLEMPICKNNLSKYFFSSRVIKPWNSLSQDLISIKNPKLFKKQVSKADLSQFLTIPFINPNPPLVYNNHRLWYLMLVIFFVCLWFYNSNACLNFNLLMFLFVFLIIAISSDPIFMFCLCNYIMFIL